MAESVEEFMDRLREAGGTLTVTASDGQKYVATQYKTIGEVNEPALREHLESLTRIGNSYQDDDGQIVLSARYWQEKIINPLATALGVVGSKETPDA